MYLTSSQGCERSGWDEFGQQEVDANQTDSPHGLRDPLVSNCKATFTRIVMKVTPLSVSQDLT